MEQPSFGELFVALASDVASTLQMESALSGKAPLKIPKPRGRKAHTKRQDEFVLVPQDPVELTRDVLQACTRKRKQMGQLPQADTSDQALSRQARFTDKFKLAPYESFLHYVPRIVNVVTFGAPASNPKPSTRHEGVHVASTPIPRSTGQSLLSLRDRLAEAIPVAGSGITLPLDLHHIAAFCRNSYFAPKRFSAVQLAYSEPRCRVLVFRECSAPTKAALPLATR